MRAVDQGADLAELDEELRRIGWDDEDVWVRLEEDAGLFFVDLTHVFAGGYGFFDASFEVGGFGDAGAVVADAAEGGQFPAVGAGFARLAFALEGESEHEGEGVFAGAARAGEDHGVREPADGDGGAEAVDGGGVTDEVGEGCGERHRFQRIAKRLWMRVPQGFGMGYAGGNLAFADVFRSKKPY